MAAARLLDVRNAEGNVPQAEGIGDALPLGPRSLRPMEVEQLDRRPAGRFEERHVGRHVLQARHVVDPRPADRNLPGQPHSQHAAIEINHRPHVGDNQVDVVNSLEHVKKTRNPGRFGRGPKEV